MVAFTASVARVRTAGGSAVARYMERTATKSTYRSRYGCQSLVRGESEAGKHLKTQLHSLVTLAPPVWFHR